MFVGAQPEYQAGELRILVGHWSEDGVRTRLRPLSIAAMTSFLEQCTSAPLSRLAGLAWPIVVARSTQVVIGLADALMIASLGEDALAATTTGATNTFALIILPIGTVQIIQSFASQLSGRGDVLGARRYGMYGLLVAGLFGLLAVGVIPLVASLVGMLDLGTVVGAKMTLYIQIRLLSVAPVIATEALGSYFGGLGNTQVAMRCGVLAMLANVALNFLLIQPRFGLPGYGVAGAASASVVATCLGLLPALLPFLRKRGAVGRISGRELMRVLRFGLPNGVNWFLEFGAFAFFINVVMGHLGTSALAAFNVVIQLNSVAFMPAFGVASAGAILVGEAIGQDRRERVPALVWLTMKVAAGWMLSVGALYVLMPGVLLGPFAVPEPSATMFFALGLQMLGYAALWQLGDAISLTLSEALRAAGDTAWNMIARSILAWCVFVPGSYLLVVVAGGRIATAMLSLVLFTFAIAAVIVFRFISGRWRHIALVEPQVE